jgi:PTS system beta-glucosides-specific IIC component
MPRDQEGIASAVLTLLVLIPAVVLVLGPLGIFLNDHIGDAIASLMGNAPVLNLLLLGLVYSLLVMTGLQFVLIPLMLNELAANGSTMLLPATAAAMMGHAGAALAVALREQRPDSRRLAFWAAGAALLGTPEPAMYAVNMKRRAAFGSALLGGAAGGLYIGLFSVKAVAFGGGLSLLEFPLLLDEGTPSLLQGMTGIILAYVFAAALAFWLLGRKGSRGAVEGERSS